MQNLARIRKLAKPLHKVGNTLTEDSMVPPIG